MRTTLSEAARAEIDTLRADGIDLTPEEVVELNAIGWEIETPEIRRELSRGTPVTVGGATLRPLTLAGWAWFERVGDKGSDQDAALGYAMAFGGDPAIDTASMADVDKWKDGLTCTPRELTCAIAEVIANERGLELPPAKVNDTTPADIVASVMAECGGTPDVWERHVRIGYLTELLAAVGRSRGGESSGPSPNDPRVKATAAIMWCAEKIRRSRKETNGR